MADCRLMITLMTCTLVGAGSASAQRQPEVKGVQAVLLHCWAASSRNLLKDVLSTHNYIAISSAPYLKVKDAGDRDRDRNSGELVEPCAMASGQKNRLGNIARLVSDLSTTPELHVIVFAGNLHDGSPIRDLTDRFAAIWTGLILPAADKSNIYFHAGASLEDDYSTAEVDKAFQLMAQGIPATDSATLQRLVTAGRFTFHRSPNGGKGDANNVSVDVVVGGVTIPVSVTHERHGRTPDNSTTDRGAARYDFWSNDGPFVYYNRTRKEEECECGLDESPFRLSQFKSQSLTGRFRLLWRPAYNLHPWTSQTQNGTVTRTFTRTTALRKDGSRSGFDTWEAEVLREFLD